MRTRPEHRRRTRVACSLPARLVIPTMAVEAWVLDASWWGARVRVPGGPFGLYHGSSVSFAAMRIAAALGKAFEGTLLADEAGVAVTRTFRPVRIGLKGCALPDVDVGCSFSPPLTDEEAARLGLALPLLDGTGAETAALVTPLPLPPSVRAGPPPPRPLPPTPVAPAPQAAPSPRAPRIPIRLRVQAPITGLEPLPPLGR